MLLVVAYTLTHSLTACLCLPYVRLSVHSIFGYTLHWRPRERLIQRALRPSWMALLDTAAAAANLRSGGAMHKEKVKRRASFVGGCWFSRGPSSHSPSPWPPSSSSSGRRRRRSACLPSIQQRKREDGKIGMSVESRPPSQSLTHLWLRTLYSLSVYTGGG